MYKYMDSIYITDSDFRGLRSDLRSALDKEVWDKKKYVPVISDTEERIMLEYACDILTRLCRITAKQDYRLDVILDSLRVTNWTDFSVGGKAEIHGEKAVRKRLGIKRKMRILDLLYEQAKYLERAAGFVISQYEDIELEDVEE